MITEPEINFRKRRLRAVGESLLGDDLGWLDRRVSNGGDSDHRIPMAAAVPMINC